MKNVYIGIDPSFSATGIVVMNNKGEATHAGTFGFKTCTKDKKPFWKTIESNFIEGFDKPILKGKIIEKSNDDRWRIYYAHQYIASLLVELKGIAPHPHTEYHIGLEIPMGAHLGAGAKTDRVFASFVLAILQVNKAYKNITLYTMVPGVIKKFITGKGNAKKELILKEVYKKYKFDTTDNNIADAFAIAKYIQKTVEDKK